MRKALLFVLALALVPASIAVAESTGLKVTGGGQVIVSGQNGAGDTIAFTAQQTAEPEMNADFAPAKGELQVVNRTAGVGPAQVRFHGDVTCIREVTFEDSSGNEETYIRFGGFEKVRGRTTTTPFTVDTQDRGEGAQNEDYILFRERPQDADPCDDEELETELRSTELARGNVQAH